MFDSTDLGEQSIPGRVQALARLRFAAFGLLFAGGATAFWFAVMALPGRRGVTMTGTILVLFALALAAFVAGLALAVLALLRSRGLKQEIAGGEKKTEILEWNDPRISVTKGVVNLAVSGPCVLCRAPASEKRLLRAQLQTHAYGGGVAGYAIAAGRYAREKRKYGWPEGAKLVHVAVPLCEGCKVRFPRWTLALLGLGVVLAAASFLVRLPDYQRLLAIFLPPSLGGAVALAGLAAAEQPVPARIRKFRKRLEIELPLDATIIRPVD